MSAPPPLCSLDGRVGPLAEARISPLDRGFLFGDSVYETMKVLGGHPLFLPAHLARLAASLAGFEIPWPEGLAAEIAALLAATGPFDGSLYVQVTRGAAPQRLHQPGARLTPTRFLLPAAYAFPADPAAAPGLTAITRPDWRWQRCDLKTTALAGSVLGGLAAAHAGADEVLFAGPGGELREGGHTNLFVRHGEVLETHPLGAVVLPGVTRSHLLDLAAGLGLTVVERAPRLADREAWRELFVSGTLTGVRGVVQLDGTPVGDGTVGPWTRRLAAALAARERAAAEEAG